MNQILEVGQEVYTDSSKMVCQVEEYLGGGGQGEVYRANLGRTPVALKWYFPQYVQHDQRLRERLERAIELGLPSDRFLWPIELASVSDVPEFGYIMPLRESRFKSIIDLLYRRVNTNFRALATAGFELAHSFLQIHTKGLCYRDISFGNVFFDPQTGEIRICDNDNVDVDGQPGAIDGTPYFMAPEIVTGKANPSSITDLYSLAVLIFYMFFNNHPLFGRKLMNIKCQDAPALRKLCGEEPVFIFDPVDTSNPPVPLDEDDLKEAGGYAIIFWEIYPEFLKDLFIKAFTDGIRNPQHGRVMEGEWRSAMVSLRDSIVFCPYCGKQSFYDAEALKASGGKPGTCWFCQKEIKLPARIRIGRQVIMLNFDTKLYPHHVDSQRMYDFSQPVAELAQHPNDPHIWGIRNLTQEKWVAKRADGNLNDVLPGKTITLGVGTIINFGKTEGEIRL